MTDFVRYAIYHLPDDEGFARLAAAWLGWDVLTGRDCGQPVLAGLPRPLAGLTEVPRRYGFHATVKPPFRLGDGLTADALDKAAAALCDGAAAVTLDALVPAMLEGFAAFVPEGGEGALTALAARVVEGLDRFRAPLTGAEIARRNPGRLTDRQRRYLGDWGYPYVMEEFRFHMTLSGPLAEAEGPVVQQVAADYFAPVPLRPYALRSLCLCGEDAAGRFHLIRRYPLSG